MKRSELLCLTVLLQCKIVRFQFTTYSSASYSHLFCCNFVYIFVKLLRNFSSELFFLHFRMCRRKLYGSIKISIFTETPLVVTTTMSLLSLLLTGLMGGTGTGTGLGVSGLRTIVFDTCGVLGGVRKYRYFNPSVKFTFPGTSLSLNINICSGLSVIAKSIVL